MVRRPPALPARRRVLPGHRPVTLGSGRAGSEACGVARWRSPSRSARAWMLVLPVDAIAVISPAVWPAEHWRAFLVTAVINWWSRRASGMSLLPTGSRPGMCTSWATQEVAASFDVGASPRLATSANRPRFTIGSRRATAPRQRSKAWIPSRCHSPSSTQALTSGRESTNSRPGSPAERARSGPLDAGSAPRTRVNAPINRSIPAGRPARTTTTPSSAPSSPPGRTLECLGSGVPMIAQATGGVLDYVVTARTAFSWQARTPMRSPYSAACRPRPRWGRRCGPAQRRPVRS
jgi:hypothetical protein